MSYSYLPIDDILNYFEGDAHLMRRSIDLFYNKVDNYVDDVRSSIENKDYRKMKLSSHSFKGVCASFKLLNFVEEFRQLETLAEQENYDTFVQQFNDVEKKVMTLKKEMKDFLIAT